jgi:transcriptional regulator with XRE-family HTH domain
MDSGKLIGQRIRDRRTEIGLSPEDVASAAHCSARTLLTMELGTGKYPVDRLERIAIVLSVSLEWLIFGKYTQKTAEGKRKRNSEAAA